MLPFLADLSVHHQRSGKLNKGSRKECECRHGEMSARREETLQPLLSAGGWLCGHGLSWDATTALRGTTY